MRRRCARKNKTVGTDVVGKSTIHGNGRRLISIGMGHMKKKKLDEGEAFFFLIKEV
jgi:hypothetical protein